MVKRPYSGTYSSVAKYGKVIGMELGKQLLPFARKYVADKVGEMISKPKTPAKTKKPKSDKKKRRRGKVTYATTGSYGGKFKKSDKTDVSKVYANKGVWSTFEVQGTTSDPDCLYVTHMAIDSFQMVELMILSLFRKLFQKAGYNISNISEILGSINIGNSQDWQIELTQYNQLTGVESVLQSYTTVAADSLITIASQFNANFMLFSSGATTTPSIGAAANDLRLYRLILYQQDYNVTLGKVHECAIQLEDEIVHYYGRSELKVQNRTKSASGSGDSEDVSNNPLVGRLYKFSGIPKCRNKANYPLISVPVNNGVQLCRAAEFTGNSTMKEPPSPTIFSNCKGSSLIRLEPGQIKETHVKVKKSGSFLNLLQKMRLQYGVGTGFKASYSMFPSEIVSLEDVINVNSSELISLAYEANRVLGAYLVTKKKARGLVAYGTLNYSNNPA